MARQRKRANGEGSVYQVFYTSAKVNGRYKQIRRNSREELVKTLEQLKRTHGIEATPIVTKWVAQVTIGYKSDGKPYRKTFFCNTRKEAQAKLTSILTEKQNGGVVDPSHIKVGDWLEEWLEMYKKLTIEETTYDLYRTVTRLHIIPEIGHIPLDKLTTHDIQALLYRKQKKGRKDGQRGGLSSRTLHLIRSLLQQSLDKAVRLRMIPRNPATEAECPSLRHKPIEPLEEEDVARFFNVAENIAFFRRLSSPLAEDCAGAKFWG